MEQALPIRGLGPTPRSGCQMTVTPQGSVLIYGGYSKQVRRAGTQGLLPAMLSVLPAVRTSNKTAP